MLILPECKGLQGCAKDFMSDSTVVKKKLPKAIWQYHHISVEKFKICNKNIEIGYVCFLRTIMTQGEEKFVLCQFT